MNNKPLISIITICKNSEKFIEESILSVISQNYQNIEYIIIDGDSKDSTKKIINKYREHINIFISEEDNGIYDAINKGISLCQGEIIKILNSDDKLNPNALEKVAIYFQNNSLINQQILVISNTLVIDRNNKICGEINRFTKNMIGFHSFNHPGWFMTKEVYNFAGPYNTDLKISSDFEYFMRIKKLKINIKYFNEALTCFRKGGRSSVDLLGPIEVLTIHFKYKIYLKGLLVFVQHSFLRILQIIYRYYRYLIR